MSSSLRSASNASAAVFPDKKNCWLFSIFGVNMATPPKIPMFHATFNSSRLIWEKILLRVFQNSAMKKARAARTLGETRRTAIPRQKMPKGASLQRFLPWLAENATMGPLGAPRSHRKSSKKSGEARKAAGKPPIGPRTPRWTHAARPPGGVSCHPASKTAQPPLSRKEKPAKCCEHLAGFDPNRPRTASSLPAAALRRG